MRYVASLTIILLSSILLPASSSLRAASPNISSIPGVTLQSADAASASIAREDAGCLVTFQPGEWPQVRWNCPLGVPWDWSNVSAIAIDVVNINTFPVDTGIRVDDTPGWNSFGTGLTSVAPKSSVTLLFPLVTADSQKTMGMRAGPPISPESNRVTLQLWGTVNTSHIYRFQLFSHRPTQNASLIVSNIRLIGGGSANMYDGIVDQYGQYARQDWSGKIHADADFSTRRADEQKDLAAHPSLDGRDEYGGWAHGPQLAAKGYFSTVKRGGVWWLVTPTGHLFFSLGIDVIQPNMDTVVEHRPQLFTWLPAEGDTLSSHYGYAGNIIMSPYTQGKTFDFYAANLERKFGADYNKTWTQLAAARLKSWGFNTVGNWSNDAVGAQHKVPYVATLGVYGDFKRVASGGDYWAPMPDPFDPKFAEAASHSIASRVARLKNDPWCVGYFVDNELSWSGWDQNGHYGLAKGALASGPDQPAKIAFIQLIQDEYGSIGNLNNAWSTTFASWDDLKAPYHVPDKPGDRMVSDFSQYLTVYAFKYFTTINSILKAVDPNHLYLGCRFAQWSPEAVKVAAGVCDVVSFNIYDKGAPHERFSLLKDIDKPCIIGEFHFGALDRGMFHPGLVKAENQAQRARMFADYMKSAYALPQFVGAHWFEYVDEPLAGRSLDGENYNIGFVSVTDTPYPEMVAGARAVNADAYRLHGAATNAEWGK